MKVTEIRFGGREVDETFRFELTGGALALDFVNTLDEREATPKELLTDYQRLLEWSEQVGVLSKHECRQLRSYADDHPIKASNALRSARELRQTVFDCIVGIVAGGGIKDSDFAQLNRWVARAQAKRRLQTSRKEVNWSYIDADQDLSKMLWPVIFSIAELLTNKQSRSKLRTCEGEGCAWAFLDQSRHTNRRWCDMSVCGNRAKARRYRRRKLLE